MPRVRNHSRAIAASTTARGTADLTDVPGTKPRRVRAVASSRIPSPKRQNAAGWKPFASCRPLLQPPAAPDLTDVPGAKPRLVRAGASSRIPSPKRQNAPGWKPFASYRPVLQSPAAPGLSDVPGTNSQIRSPNTIARRGNPGTRPSPRIRKNLGALIEDAHIILAN